MAYVSWSIGSTNLSILRKMEASPLPFSACYLNSHVNAALKLGDKGAVASSLVEADYLSWQPQAISVSQPARQMCLHHSCVAVETTAASLLTETKVHPS